MTPPAVEPQIDTPGYPPGLRLVPPQELPRRGMGSPSGRTTLLHALAHIEFNAVNLALDACWRFRGMPAAYYADWLHVAREEADHFALLEGALQQRGCRYGDFPAHQGLWDMARRTAHDVLARMALVPRILEARGLDVTPDLRRRFAAAGEADIAAILDRILADEIGHVAIGNRWFAWQCEHRGLDRMAAFAQLCTEHQAPVPRGPINRAGRLLGGFTPEEIDRLEAQSRTRFRKSAETS
jgi:uncharacterized ferritin-like protein (DUF455 family)